MDYDQMARDVFIDMVEKERRVNAELATENAALRKRVEELEEVEKAARAVFSQEPFLLPRLKAALDALQAKSALEDK